MYVYNKRDDNAQTIGIGGINDVNRFTAIYDQNKLPAGVQSFRYYNNTLNTDTDIQCETIAFTVFETHPMKFITPRLKYGNNYECDT